MKYNNLHLEAKNTTDAYNQLLWLVYAKWDYKSEPRGLAIREKLNVQITIENPTDEPIVTADYKRNDVIEEYTKKELDWYLSGETSADSAPSKFWKTIENEEGQINSNYGHITLFDRTEFYTTPYYFARNALKKDKDTRQAICRYNKAKHANLNPKDFVCTMYQNFHIREDKLHSTVRMRSADLFTGPVYDIPWFVHLMKMMRVDLLSTYPDLELGNLTFSADSLHIYEKDIDAVCKMINFWNQSIQQEDFIK
jgi:thymidylate synthase